MVVLRRVGVAVLLVTGAVALAVPFSAPRSPADVVAHVAAGVVLVGCGATLAVLRAISRQAVLVVLLGVIGMIGVLTWVADPVTIEPLLVIGPILLLAGFYDGGETLAGYLMAVAGLGAALGLEPPTELEAVSVVVTVVVAGLLVALVRGVARVSADPEAARQAEHARGAPMSEPELRARLEVLAEVAIVQGSPLALVVVAPVDRGAAEQRVPRAQLVRALIDQSRGDDLIAELDDAVGVLLPGAARDEAVGYAARVAVALRRPAPQGLDRPVAVGVALVVGDPYPAAALLRRSREALEGARAVADGRIGLAERSGVALLDVPARVARARGTERRASRV